MFALLTSCFVVSVIYQQKKGEGDEIPEGGKPTQKVPKVAPTAAAKPKQEVSGALVKVPSDNIYIFIVRITDVSMYTSKDVSSKDPNITCK